jgi:hypothetical protein
LSEEVIFLPGGPTAKLDGLVLATKLIGTLAFRNIGLSGQQRRRGCKRDDSKRGQPDD